MLILSDDDLEKLRICAKRIVNPHLRDRTQRGSTGKTYDLEAADYSRFKMYIRQNSRLPENFSAGLLYCSPSGDITLARYNGPDHPHRNPLDPNRDLPAQCHIHLATERYMAAGRKSEHYAERTERYSDLDGAVRALIIDCNISDYPAAPGTDRGDQLNLLKP